MDWPERITIVDDIPVGPEVLHELLSDLSWVVMEEKALAYAISSEDEDSIKKDIAKLPGAFRDLATRDPRYFDGHIEVLIIRSSQDEESPKFIVEVPTAVERLQQSTSGIAFIDFNYQYAGRAAWELLDQMYERLPAGWNRLTRLRGEYGTTGGYVFSAAFAPQIERPIRVICPSTMTAIPPEFLSNRWCTWNSEVRTVPGCFQAIRLAMERWCELQADQFDALMAALVCVRCTGMHDPDNPSLPPPVLDALADLLRCSTGDELGSQLLDGTGAAVVKEALKSITPDCSRACSAGAAWLLALGAFRQQRPGDAWQAIFDPADLTKDALGYKASPILPLQDRPTQRRAIEAFYEMCRALYVQEGTALPLVQKVTLSPADGLRIQLRERFERLRETLLEFWIASQDGGPSPTGHTKSAAIWRYWLAAALSDFPARPSEEPDGSSELPPAFGGRDLWRMNIQQARHDLEVTEIVFYPR